MSTRGGLHLLNLQTSKWVNFKGLYLSGFPTNTSAVRLLGARAAHWATAKIGPASKHALLDAMIFTSWKYGWKCECIHISMHAHQPYTVYHTYVDTYFLFMYGLYFTVLEGFVS